MEAADKARDMRTLLSLLRDEDPPVQANILKILLCNCEDSYTSLLIRTEDGIPILEEILLSKCDERETALAVLIKVWQFYDDLAPMLIGPIVDILKNGSTCGKHSAVMALRYFTKYGNWLVRLGAVPALFNLLEDPKFTQVYGNCREKIIPLLQVVATSCKEGKRTVAAVITNNFNKNQPMLV